MDAIDYFGTGSDAGDNSFLSNFYPAPIVYEGIEYPTTEHAYQAAKTLHPIVRQGIADMATPGAAKKYCRSPKLKLREDWEDVKLLVMLDVLRLKFAPGSKLAAKLLATGNARLTEGNTWHDNQYGNCVCGRAKCSLPGKNHLGRLLMKVREELRVGVEGLEPSSH